MLKELGCRVGSIGKAFMCTSGSVVVDHFMRKKSYMEFLTVFVDNVKERISNKVL